MRKAISSDKAPRPRGPYSPAVIASGPMVYVSAQGPIDPATDQVVQGGFARTGRTRLPECGCAARSGGHIVATGRQGNRRPGRFCQLCGDERNLSQVRKSTLSGAHHLTSSDWQQRHWCGLYRGAAGRIILSQDKKPNAKAQRRKDARTQRKISIAGFASLHLCAFALGSKVNLPRNYCGSNET